MFFYFFSPFLVKVWYQSQRRTLVGSEQLLTWNGCFIFSMDGGLTGGSSGSSDSHQINLNTASLPKDSTNGCFIFFSTLCKPHFVCPLIAILCPRTHTVLCSVSETAEGTRWVHPSHTLIADWLMEMCLGRLLQCLCSHRTSTNYQWTSGFWRFWSNAGGGWMDGCMASTFLVLFSF